MTPRIARKLPLTALSIAAAAFVLAGCKSEISGPSVPQVGPSKSAPKGAGSAKPIGGKKPDITVVAEIEGPLRAPPAAEGDILINQHGFAPSAAKLAILVRSNSTPVTFTVVDAAGTVVLTGQSVNFGLNANSGQRVHQMDLSALTQRGIGYRVRVGSQQSYPFDIMYRPYGQLTQDALNYFYQSRAGEPIAAEYVPAQTPALSRAAGHTGEVVTCFAGTDVRGTVWPGCDYSQDVTGGWYDAGDYGKYAVNTGVSVWKLLNMYERRKVGGNLCHREFSDGSLPMPQNNDGANDLLDEARYGIMFLLRSQSTSTSPVAMSRGPQRASGPLAIRNENPFGMVHHKVHSLRWASDNVAPADDDLPRALYPPSTAATLHLAAIGAQCARIYGATDTPMSSLCLTRAELAWDAAQRLPDAYSYNNFTGGGPYNDTNLADEFGWAATELWLSTGKEKYAEAMTRYLPNLPRGGDFGWGYVAHLASLSLVTHSRMQPADQWTPRQREAYTAIEETAQSYIAQTPRSGFGLPFAETEFYWGSNGTHLNRAIILGVANDMTGRSEFGRGVQQIMDYLLGRNAVSRSYISGYGDAPMRNPHHRFWAAPVNASLPRVPPGVVSGGPNNTAPIDPVAIEVARDCTGQTCWADEFDAYSLNEVAINWNSSLAWAANWMDGRSQNCQSAERDTRHAE